MGLASLFGRGGYSSKTFENNTRIFTDKIQDMIRRCSGNYGVSDTLNRVVTQLNSTRYQSDWTAEKIEAVDNRILRLLNQMMVDIQQNKNAKLSAHASMLEEAVMSSRAFGEEQCSAKQLASGERLAEIFAFMEEIIEQKALVKAEMDRIYAQSQNMADDDPRLDLLDSKYGQCEMKLQSLDERFLELREEYNTQMQESEIFADDEFYDQIPKDVTSPAQLESAIKSVATKRSERTRVRSSKNDMISGYKEEKLDSLRSSSGATTSSLRDKRQAEKAAAVSGAIDNASNGASAPRSGLRARRDS